MEPTDETLVIATLEFAPPLQDTIASAFSPVPVTWLRDDDASGIAAALSRARAAILRRNVDERFLQAPNLEWVHCDLAGLDASADPRLFERGIAVTGSAGRSAEAIAEHAMFFTLGLIYDANALHQAQREHRWGGIPGYSARRSLYGRTVGILGSGHVGTAVASRMKSFGVRLLVCRSTDKQAPLADATYRSSDRRSLEEFLRATDILIVAAPLTDETRHLIGERELGLMPENSYVVNVGRGAVIDEVALTRALRTKVIAGAGLDVFEHEPLDQESPLWDLPNVMITPHATPTVSDQHERSTAIIVENARRFLRGEPLINRLEPQHVYSGAWSGAR